MKNSVYIDQHGHVSLLVEGTVKGFITIPKPRSLALAIDHQKGLIDDAKANVLTGDDEEEKEIIKHATDLIKLLNKMLALSKAYKKLVYDKKKLKGMRSEEPRKKRAEIVKKQKAVVNAYLVVKRKHKEIGLKQDRAGKMRGMHKRGLRV